MQGTVPTVHGDVEMVRRLEGHRSQNCQDFRFFSILLVILKFEILFKNIKSRSVTSMIFFKIIEANLKF